MRHRGGSPRAGLVRALGLLAALLIAAGPSRADALLEEAAALLEQGRAGQAFELLDARLTERAAEVRFNYLLGIAALDSGHPGDAVFAFERALSVDPNHTQARAELARAYVALGELDAAEAELARVQKMQPPAEVSQAIARYREAIRERRLSLDGKRRSAAAYVALTLGYDTNANSGTDDERIFVPLLGGTATLNRVSVAEGSLLTDARTGFTVEEREGDVAWFAGLDLGGRYHFREPGFYVRSLDGKFGLRFYRGRDTISVAMTRYDYLVNRFHIDGFTGISAQWARVLDQNNRITAFGRAESRDHPESDPALATALDRLETNFYMAGLGWTTARPLFEGRPPALLSVSGYAGTEREKADNPDTSGRNMVGLRLSGQQQITGRTLAYASLAAQLSNYGGQEVFFLDSRRDVRLDASAGLAYGLDKHWSLRPRLSYTLNQSNIDLHDFDRAQVLLTLRRDIR